MKKITFVLTIAFLITCLGNLYAQDAKLTVKGSTHLATESGNVGIGTTGPQRKLNIHASNWGAGIARFQNHPSYYLDIGDTSGTPIIKTSQDLTLQTAGSGNVFMFKNGSTELVRIKSDGNVGIGTTEPGVKLDVVGCLNMGDVNASTRQWLTIRTGPHAHGEYVSPGIDFSLNDNTHRGIVGINGGNHILSGANRGAFCMRSSDAIEFGTSGNNRRMIIDTAGNVGIGTTTPSEKLEVDGIVKAKGSDFGDITFRKDGEKLWRMFEDEDGLYVESLKTDKIYKFVLQEVTKK